MLTHDDLFQNALDAIVITDYGGVVREVNFSAQKLFKKRGAKLIGSKIDDLLDLNLSAKRGEATLKSTGSCLQFTRTDGSQKKSRLYFFRDITEIRQEVQRREHFLGIAGHELKNPLAAIKALDSMLLLHNDVKQNPYLKEQIQKIDNRVDILTELIKELLDITKIKHRRFGLTLEKVNFKKFVMEIANDFEQTRKNHKVTVHATKNFYVYIDRARIRQVLINLFRNASKYSPDNNNIFVNIDRSKRYIKCEVIDYGIGIPKDQIDKIFNLYYRIPGREKTFEGLGVGLFISREIIKAHGGVMRVKSAPGKGSQFIFKIPWQ